MHLIALSWTVLISILLCWRANGEKFSALSEMETLAKDEEIIIRQFEVFFFALEDFMNYLKQKLELWKNENQKVRADIEKYVTHPINAFLIIKRLTVDIDELYFENIGKIIDEFRHDVNDFRPTIEDLLGATDGLLRLQRMFKLKTEDITEGIIDGHKSQNLLTRHDLFSIARMASQIQGADFYVREYYEAALNSYDPFNEVPEREIFVKLNEIHESGIDIRPQSDSFVKNGHYSAEKEDILYSKLCRNEGTKSPAERKNLKCSFVSKSSFSSIAPFKVEEADHRTGLVIFHDVIYESEIKVLKIISRAKFERGLVLEGANDKKKSRVRTAKVAWFRDDEYEIARKISERVEDMTGLSTKSAESLQMQNYGIGGHYKPHWDHRLKHETDFDLGTGNRIATVLFYLSTVEHGGATVFPYAKVHVPAVKGTAAFWYNLDRSGESEFYTRHAACPVLIGSKWVANKWIHEHENELRRPCLPIRKFMESTEDEYRNEFY